MRRSESAWVEIGRLLPVRSADTRRFRFSARWPAIAPLELTRTGIPVCVEGSAIAMPGTSLASMPFLACQQGSHMNNPKPGSKPTPPPPPGQAPVKKPANPASAPTPPPAKPVDKKMPPPPPPKSPPKG
jgi:hypothetical protein